MNTTDSSVPVYQSARLLLKELQSEFDVFQKCVPLVIGIDKQLIARLPEHERKVLRTALGLHTNSLRYLKGMANATARFDLDGNVSGEITEAHRTHACATLKDRISKDNERRKIQRQAEQAQLRAEEAQREADKTANRRAEKLQLLAAKFGRASS